MSTGMSGMYVFFFFILFVLYQRKEIGGRRLDDMSCVPGLFGLCMYTLRGTGGLEEEGKESREDLLGGLGFF